MLDGATNESPSVKELNEVCRLLQIRCRAIAETHLAKVEQHETLMLLQGISLEHSNAVKQQWLSAMSIRPLRLSGT